MSEILLCGICLAIWIIVRITFLVIYKLFSKRNLIRLSVVSVLYFLCIILEIHLMYTASDIESAGMGLYIWIILIILETVFCKKIYLDEEGRTDIGMNKRYIIISNIIAMLAVLIMSGDIVLVLLLLLAQLWKLIQFLP